MRDNLNFKGFGIMDAAGNHVKAGAGFAYKGFIISLTAIYPSPAVAVFVDNADAPIAYDAKSVEDAIEWCNDSMNQLTHLGYMK